VADNFINRNADAFGISPVIKRCGNGIVPGGKFMNHGIDFFRGDTRPDDGFRHIQGVQGQAPSFSNAGDIFRGFEPDLVFSDEFTFKKLNRVISDFLGFGRAAFLEFPAAAARTKAVTTQFIRLDFQDKLLKNG
jgi:hypothetical protein